MAGMLAALIAVLQFPSVAHPARWAIVAVAVLICASIIASEFFAQLGERERQLRERVRDQKYEDLHGLVKRLVEGQPTGPPLEVGHAEMGEVKPISEGDPRIYVHLLDKRTGGRSLPMTPFVVHNQGGSVAHNIQIEPICLPLGSAQFKKLGSLGIGKEKEIIPEIEESGIFFKHSLFHLLQAQWNAANNLGATEFIVHCGAIYTDFSGDSKFRVSFDMVYLPIKDILDRTWKISGERGDVFEIRGTEFRCLRRRSR